MAFLFDYSSGVGAGVDAGTGLAGGLGMYSGPVWPQADSKPKTTAAAAILSAVDDFTFRITV
jgi:hypothetical protein